MKIVARWEFISPIIFIRAVLNGKIMNQRLKPSRNDLRVNK
jgi:hypothetical protein